MIQKYRPFLFEMHLLPKLQIIIYLFFIISFFSCEDGNSCHKTPEDSLVVVEKFLDKSFFKNRPTKGELEVPFDVIHTVLDNGYIASFLKVNLGPPDHKLFIIWKYECGSIVTIVHDSNEKDFPVGALEYVDVNNDKLKDVVVYGGFGSWYSKLYLANKDLSGFEKFTMPNESRFRLCDFDKDGKIEIIMQIKDINPSLKYDCGNVNNLEKSINPFFINPNMNFCFDDDCLYPMPSLINAPISIYHLDKDKLVNKNKEFINHLQFRFENLSHLSAYCIDDDNHADNFEKTLKHLNDTIYKYTGKSPIVFSEYYNPGANENLFRILIKNLPIVNLPHDFANYAYDQKKPLTNFQTLGFGQFDAAIALIADTSNFYGIVHEYEMYHDLTLTLFSKSGQRIGSVNIHNSIRTGPPDGGHCYYSSSFIDTQWNITVADSILTSDWDNNGPIKGSEQKSFETRSMKILANGEVVD